MKVNIKYIWIYALFLFALINFKAKKIFCKIIETFFISLRSLFN